MAEDKYGENQTKKGCVVQYVSLHKVYELFAFAEDENGEKQAEKDKAAQYESVRKLNELYVFAEDEYGENQVDKCYEAQYQFELAMMCSYLAKQTSHSNPQPIVVTGRPRCTRWCVSIDAITPIWPSMAASMRSNSRQHRRDLSWCCCCCWC